MNYTVKLLFIAILGVLSVFFFRPASSFIATKRICSNSTAEISCRSGWRISVISAIYGRKEYRVPKCGYIKILWNLWSSCYQDITEQTKQNCGNEQRCSLTASDSIYGNPCSSVGYSCYMDVSFKCILGTTTSKVPALYERKRLATAKTLFDVIQIPTAKNYTEKMRGPDQNISEQIPKPITDGSIGPKPARHVIDMIIGIIVGAVLLLIIIISVVLKFYGPKFGPIGLDRSGEATYPSSQNVYGETPHHNRNSITAKLRKLDLIHEAIFPMQKKRSVKVKKGEDRQPVMFSANQNHENVDLGFDNEPFYSIPEKTKKPERADNVVYKPFYG